VGLVPPEGTVLDLYSGVGLFSVGLAASAEAVVGVEGNETAVADAVANADGLENVRFVTGDVLAALPHIPVTAGERIVLDPPRVGLGAALVAAVAARQPSSVVYVSCDPPTLGRDLHDFANAGYVPDTMRAFDLFPDTFHLETVVRLKPR
jgi:tRNA/tmRNA/rRNA uracil-C5-methylase (TrmA/RlmC/RlmD family)